jgi:hypothetical protein
MAFIRGVSRDSVDAIEMLLFGACQKSGKPGVDNG